VETLTGQSLQYKHLPHQLVARNSQGETISITALIKTQGSDTKLVAQMQPYYEAKTLSRQQVGNVSIPPIVSQIGDGENGGVMMNEFPSAFKKAWYEMTDKSVVGVNGTEYLELIEAAGCQPSDYPSCQPVNQHKIWEKVPRENCTPEAVAKAIEELKQANSNFHMDGASWTNHLSWVKGYENVLSPMNQFSALFHEKLDSQANLTKQSSYREALIYNLLLQTSCFRYWGQGSWTDYAREIYRRGETVISK